MSLGTSFATRVILKLKRTVRELSPAEREFGRLWPRVAAIEGWLSIAEARWLFRTALSLPDGANLAEIGSYKGRSTSCLGFGCRGTKKRVFAIDSFDGGPDLQRHDSFAEFRLNMQDYKLSEYVEPIKGISWEIAKTWDKPINLLFIDGSHIYEDVMADFASFFPHVVPGGVVAFHDVDASFPGVLKAWNETFRPQLRRAAFSGTIAFGTKPGK